MTIVINKDHRLRCLAEDGFKRQRRQTFIFEITRVRPSQKRTESAPGLCSIPGRQYRFGLQVDELEIQVPQHNDRWYAGKHRARSISRRVSSGLCSAWRTTAQSAHCPSSGFRSGATSIATSKPISSSQPLTSTISLSGPASQMSPFS